jgi:hypothetical protein
VKKGHVGKTQKIHRERWKAFGELMGSFFGELIV